MSIFDFMLSAPCRRLTPEEIAAEYGERATRPIPPGYKNKPNVRQRLHSGGAKPFAVFAVDGNGKRRFVSSHHSIDAADAKAVHLNEGIGDNSEYRYVSGERRGSKGLVIHEKEKD